MNLNYDDDKSLHGSRAFGLGAKFGGTLDELYDHLTTPAHKDDHKFLYVLKEWNISPYTDWPNDFGRLAKIACKEISAGRSIDRDMAALLYFVQDVPGRAEQEVVAEREFLVQAGNYDPYVKNHAKFQLQLKSLMESEKFAADLGLLSEVVDLDLLAYNNVVRRTLSCERNIRPEQFYLRWDDQMRRWQHIFDGFCWNHDLYGLELIDGKWVPLLMKVTVNATPHGIIIFIPKWMSMDFARDLVVREITKLIRSRGARPQGIKRTETQLERDELARAAYKAHLAALDLDKKGDDRIDFIIKELELLPETEERRVRELVEEGNALENPSASRITIEEVRSREVTPAPETDRVRRLLRDYDELTDEELDLFWKKVEAKRNQNL